MVWAPDYVTTSELADFLRIGDADDNVELGFAVTAASRSVDNHTNRQFGQVAVAEERRYTAEWDRRRRRWVVTIDDLQDVTGLDVQVDAGQITAFTLEPVNAAEKGKAFTLLVVDPDSAVKPTGEEHEVAISALWGWTAVPATVKQATLLQASRFHARRFSPYGIAGSPDTGSEMRLLARVDPDVAVALSDYVRWWAAA